jgi:hypothetical protein
MVGKFYKSVRISPARFSNDFASFDGTDLTEESEDQVLSHRNVLKKRKLVEKQLAIVLSSKI